MGESFACVGAGGGFFARILALCMRDIADNRLATFTDGHVLYRYLLFPAGPVALERLHLASISAGQLVERVFGAILLR